jgi:hypothetical protein
VAKIQIEEWQKGLRRIAATETTRFGEENFGSHASSTGRLSHCLTHLIIQPSQPWGTHYPIRIPSIRYATVIKIFLQPGNFKDEEDRKCPICHDQLETLIPDLRTGTELSWAFKHLVSQMKRGHIFGSKCILQWFNGSEKC